MDEALRRLFAEIARVMERPRELPLCPTARASVVREGIARYDFARPVRLERALGDVARMLRETSVHTNHPRHYGLFNPSVDLASVTGDALAALYNPQLAIWRQAPCAVEIEQHTLRTLARAFGLESDDGAFTFTHGGAEANQSALVAALTRAHPEYAARGARVLAGDPVVYASEQAHASLAKACHAAGIGRAALRAIPVDTRLRLAVPELERALREDRAQGRVPVMVIGTAGTTSSGAIDPLDAMGEVCAREGVWFHVDGAYGAAFALVPRLRAHLAGIERADSLAVDAHKALSVAMGTGMFFCRHRDVVARAFAAGDAVYMPRDAQHDRVQPFNETAQWSRRFTGLKVFLTLAELGIEGVTARLERMADLGDALRARLLARGFVLESDAVLPVVCFTDPREPADHKRLRARIESLHRAGAAWISETTLPSPAGPPRSVLRACVTSFRTDESDLDALVAQLADGHAG